MSSPRFKPRGTWREKLEKRQERRVVPIPPQMAARLGPGTLLIPQPLDVDAVVRQIPRGRVATVPQIRESLARRYGADTSCPLCTGLFIRIVAETAEEDLATGRGDASPYWRVVSARGALNPKFPGGAEAQAERLRGEGHRLVPGTGNRPPSVEGFQEHLAAL